MYIPKNRILTNQYSNDRKLVYKTSQEVYIGSYYKTFDGKYFTGKTPNDPPNLELLFVEDTENSFTPLLPQNKLAYGEAPTIFDSIDTPGYSENMVITYAGLQGINLDDSTRKFLPYQCYPPPTPNDYEIGSFTRYFSMKINTNSFLELDKKLYDKLNSKNGDYLWEPYLLIIIPWTIAGVESSVNLTNSNIVQLQEKRMKIVGLGRFLKFDFLRYYK
jgi:hypothetical protein|tara:strand:- start:3934 stop:4587 length:654 start_codon:yes stop_codon:yes gene_type:complete